MLGRSVIAIRTDLAALRSFRVHIVPFVLFAICLGFALQGEASARLAGRK